MLMQHSEPIDDTQTSTQAQLSSEDIAQEQIEPEQAVDLPLFHTEDTSEAEQVPEVEGPTTQSARKL